jgi:hypothetical protein
MTEHNEYTSGTIARRAVTPTPLAWNSYSYPLIWRRAASLVASKRD